MGWHVLDRPDATGEERRFFHRHRHPGPRRYVLLIPTAHTCAPISALGVVVQFQSRSGPIDRYQLAGCEQRDIRSSQVWTAKADIGGYRIGHRDVLNRFAVW
jgi:hypothetical protein